MNEDLGTLSFKFRAEKAQYLADLAEMDRATEEKRRKWESPVRFSAQQGGGSAGGAPGGGAVASTAGASGRGLNVLGTSNGDVSWNLRDAVNSRQYRQDMQVSRSRAGKRMLDDYYPGGPPGDEGGSAADIDPNLMKFARQQKAMFSKGKTSEYDAPYGSSSRVNRYTGGRLGETEEEIDPGKVNAGTKAKGMPGFTKLRNLIRYTVAGLVVDAIAGEIGNVSNYSKAMQEAGMNSGAQGRAQLGAFSSALGSIPIIGGMLQGLASPFASGIEMDLNRAQAIQEYGDTRYAANYANATQGLNNQNTLLAGTAGGAFTAYKERNRERMLAHQKNEQSILAKAEKAIKPLGWFQRSYEYASNSMLNYGIFHTKYDRDSYLANIEQREGEHQQDSMRPARDMAAADLNRMNSENATDLRKSRIDFSNNIDLIHAANHRQYMSNQFKPFKGSTEYETDTAAISLKNFKALNAGVSSDSDEGKANIAMEKSILYGNMLNLQSQKKDLQTNYLFGGGEQFNPYTESPYQHIDRDPETMADKNKDIYDAMHDLASVMKDLTKAINLMPHRN